MIHLLGKHKFQFHSNKAESILFNSKTSTVQLKELHYNGSLIKIVSEVK